MSIWLNGNVGVCVCTWMKTQMQMSLIFSSFWFDCLEIVWFDSCIIIQFGKKMRQKLMNLIGLIQISCDSVFVSLFGLMIISIVSTLWLLPNFKWKWRFFTAFVPVVHFPLSPNCRVKYEDNNGAKRLSYFPSPSVAKNVNGYFFSNQMVCWTLSLGPVSNVRKPQKIDKGRATNMKFSRLTKATDFSSHKTAIEKYPGKMILNWIYSVRIFQGA